MDVGDLLLELYERIPPLARGVVADLSPAELTRSPAPGTNPVGWLVWHLARTQDHHVAEILDEDQLWVTGAWAARFGLDPDPADTGYGHSPTQVASVRPESSSVLIEHLDAVQARTTTLIADLSPRDLDRVVDRSWDPPVTLGVRLVSVADDSLQHLGQAAYVRGLLGR